MESAVLVVRDRYGWGPRKIHAVLRRDRFAPLPSLRSVGNILKRNGRIEKIESESNPSSQRFERGEPNELWQMDHKGPIEVQRIKLTPLTIIDDHSRYALAFHPLSDKTYDSAFSVLWNVMGDVGMPQSILSDNAFGSHSGGVSSLSRFDMMLIRLGINPIHGRAYHPQTQGKVEAFHGSVMRELIRRNARRDCLEHFNEDVERWRVEYNTERPHEALGDEVPLSRWKPSVRVRPSRLPEVEYDPGTVTRRVANPGLISWRNTRIRVGVGLVGESVLVEELDRDVVIRYSFKTIRRLSVDQLTKDRVV